MNISKRNKYIPQKNGYIGFVKFYENKFNKKRCDYVRIALDDLIPKNHLLRKINQIIDFSFNQKSIGIHSILQAVKKIQVNVSYR